MTVAEFRALMPAFGDAAVYTDEDIQGWLDLAALLLRPERWRSVLPLGIRLFVAHNLKLADDQAAGNVSGGLVTDKAVGPVKVSYDVTVGLSPADGIWSLTTYGRQFAYYLRLAGMGGVQVSGAGARGAMGFGGYGPYGSGYGGWQ